MSLVADQALAGFSRRHFPNNHESNHFEDIKPKSQQNDDMGGWGFLQSLCSSSSNNNNAGIFRNRGDSSDCTDKVYIHPLVKRPSSKLTEKSLKMCTESLGCESGSESGEDISLLAVEATSTVPMESLPNRLEVKKKPRTTRSYSFPPPLNSASGSSYVHIVRSYREHGRVVVRAIRVSSPPPCFTADRSEGRLRLCLSDDYSSSLSFDDEEEENEENEFGLGSYKGEGEEEEGEEEEEEKDEKDEEETEATSVDEEEAAEGIEENKENFEGKIGNGKFRRPSSRCKENGHQQKVLLNWKNQFCVAT